MTLHVPLSLVAFGFYVQQHPKRHVPAGVGEAASAEAQGRTLRATARAPRGYPGCSDEFIRCRAYQDVLRVFGGVFMAFWILQWIDV